MPKGTRVHRCVDKVKRSGKKGVNPYAVCQASTDQSYATGKTLKEDRKEALRVLSSKRSTKASRKARKDAGGTPKENVPRRKSSGFTTSTGERVTHVTGGRNNPGIKSSSGRLLGGTAGLTPKQKRQMQKDLIQRGSVSDSREYKRIGILIAEAMGYRVDEIAPVVAAVGRQVVTQGALALGHKKLRKKGGKLGQVASRVLQREQEGDTMNKYVKALTESREYKKPRGRGQGSGPSTQHEYLGGSREGRGAINKRTVISPGSRPSGRGMTAGAVSYSRTTNKPRGGSGPLSNMPLSTNAPIEGRARDVVRTVKRVGAGAIKKVRGLLGKRRG